MPSEPHSPPPVPEYFEILERIGQGGMGIVYRAVDRRLRREVALKVLNPDLGRDSRLRKRFRREAIAASALAHPGIVTVHDILETTTHDGTKTDVIVMEHVVGGDLRRRIKAGALEVRDALEVAIQVAEAMHEAHGAGIVHRDLKPANLLIDAKGRVKIADFGIAKLDGDDPATTSRSSRAGLVGTLSYMSPEQIGNLGVDARSDVFTLGVVLYEMLAGTRPFHASSEALLLYAICREAPPNLGDHRPDMPPELVALIDRALAKKKEERYPSMAALGTDLERQLAALAATAPRRGVTPPAVMLGVEASEEDEGTHPARPHPAKPKS